MLSIRKTSFAAIAMAPLFILAVPSLASAATSADPSAPGQDQSYQNSQTTTDGNGVTTTSTESCMGADGHASYHRTTESAGPNGRIVRTTGTGAACRNSDPAAINNMTSTNTQPTARRNPAAAAQDLSGPANTPLIVVNNPMGG